MTTDRDRYRCQSTTAPGSTRCYFDAVVFNGNTETMHCAGHALEPEAAVDLEALADFATEGGGHLLRQLPKHVGLIVIRDVHEAIRKACETTIGEKRQRHFPVTDPHLDAPDGAIVDGWQRVGDTWEPLEAEDQLAGDRRTGPLTPGQLERGLRRRKKPRDLDDV